MNYQKIYEQLIEKAKREKRKKGGVYYEQHHIIPKCLGGTNSPSNLVLLTAREHYVAHCLLSLIHRNNKEAYHKLNHAVYRMALSNKGLKLTSRQYAEARQKHAEACRYFLSGVKKSIEARENMKKAQKLRFQSCPSNFAGKTHSEQTRKLMCSRQSGENNPQYGKPRTEEEKAKISATMRGQKKSPETIAKFRQKTMSPEARKKIAESVRKRHSQNKWNKRFLELAKLIATWSRDPSTKVGAVLVDPTTKRIISTGFNGFPPNHDDNPALYKDRGYKYTHIIHAEVNALNNLPFTFTGGVLYTSFHICPSCLQEAHRHGVKTVYCVAFDPSERPDWTERIEQSKALADYLGMEVIELNV